MGQVIGFFPETSSDRFWEMREELFLVLELREEKLTFTIVEGGKLDVFLI